MTRDDDRPREVSALAFDAGPARRLLVVNCGSSSLKYAFFDTADSSREARGQVDRIGSPEARHRVRSAAGETETVLRGCGFPEAFDAMLKALSAPAARALSGSREVDAVVHRIVHGASEFTAPVSI